MIIKNTNTDTDTDTNNHFNWWDTECLELFALNRSCSISL